MNRYAMPQITLVDRHAGRLTLGRRLSCGHVLRRMAGPHLCSGRTRASSEACAAVAWRFASDGEAIQLARDAEGALPNTSCAESVWLPGISLNGAYGKEKQLCVISF
jgi:hypothetical protein